MVVVLVLLVELQCFTQQLLVVVVEVAVYTISKMEVMVTAAAVAAVQVVHTPLDLAGVVTGA
jgi:hypothetical protein